MKFMQRKRTYLDTAAAHKVRPEALRAFTKGSSVFGNPSAAHKEGREGLEVLEDARTDIARLLGVKSDAVIFTSGATEANALALEGYVRAHHAAGTTPHVLYLPTQHASVLGAIGRIEALGVATEALQLKDWKIDLELLARQIRKETMLVTMDVICGETGVRHDTRGVRQVLDAARSLGENPIVLHVDATQAPLVENMERTRLGADLISFDAQKIGGVRGIGALIVPSPLILEPIVVGGGQERGLRPGTPSPALASSFASALRACAKDRDGFVTRATALRNWLKTEIQKQSKDVVVNEGKECAPHILNVSFLGRDTDYLVALLDEAGFAVSTRSACETDAEGSRVILAYTKDDARAQATLRVSFDASVTKKHVQTFSKALLAAVSFIDEKGIKMS